MQPKEEAKMKSVNFHDSPLPSELSEHMFRSTARVMPKPLLEYEKHLLEPLTSVFSDFQDSYKKQDFNSDPDLKMLPDCREFVFEVVSSNMLLEDMYAPRGRIKYTPVQTEEVKLERSRQGEEKFVTAMTSKVIAICSLVMDNLEKHQNVFPLKLTYIIRLMLDVAKAKNSVKPIEAREARLIADFFAGSWLSNAFRWPEIFGMGPAFKEEALT